MVVAAAGAGMRDARILRRVASGGAVVHVSLSLGLLVLVGTLLVATTGLVAVLIVDKDIDALTTFNTAGLIGVVVEWRGRVLRDDVPGVQEAGQEAEDAEEEVDEGVGGADAGFYPDCFWEEGMGLVDDRR